jgi:hypothetical protein
MAFELACLFNRILDALAPARRAVTEPYLGVASTLTFVEILPSIVGVAVSVKFMSTRFHCGKVSMYRDGCDAHDIQEANLLRRPGCEIPSLTDNGHQCSTRD